MCPGSCKSTYIWVTEIAVHVSFFPHFVNIHQLNPMLHENVDNQEYTRPSQSVRQNCNTFFLGNKNFSIFNIFFIKYCNSYTGLFLVSISSVDIFPSFISHFTRIFASRGPKISSFILEHISFYLKEKICGAPFPCLSGVERVSF